jgi:hypothetical protein
VKKLRKRGKDVKKREKEKMCVKKEKKKGRKGEKEESEKARKV